jgi:hypothetical protein
MITTAKPKIGSSLSDPEGMPKKPPKILIEIINVT